MPKYETLKNEEFKPFYAQLADAIKLYIKNNGLKQGDPIPSEAELIKHYKLSRATVRIALQRLHTEGLVVKKQGKGTFVAEKRIGKIIQGFCPVEESLFTLGKSVSNELLEAGVFENPVSIWLEKLNLPEGSKVFRVRRIKKSGTEKLALEIRHLPMEIGIGFTEEDIKTQSLIALLDKNSDTKPCRVVYHTTGELLLERYAELLDVPSGTLGLVQNGTYYNKADHPVMTGKLVFVAAKVKLQYEFKRQLD